MQTKENKTAEELQIEISSRLGGLAVIVHDDSISGWTATVTMPPAEVVNHEQIAQIAEVISELRAKYELKNEETKKTDQVDSEAAVPSAEPGPIADCAQTSVCSVGTPELPRSGRKAEEEKR